MEPATSGTVRSILPVTTLIQTSPEISTKASSGPRSPDTGNLFVRLGEQQKRLETAEQQDSKLVPENKNEVIKIAQVPLRLLDEKMQNSNDIQIENSDVQENANGETAAVKLDHLSSKPTSLETKHAEIDKTNLGAEKEKSKEDINKEALMVLQSRLTSIISQLEQKVNTKEGHLKQREKQDSLREIAKNKPSEKSLKFLKQRLFHVMKKFNSKPGTRQAFTIGKEWANVLNGAAVKNESKTKEAVALKKTQNASENEGTLQNFKLRYVCSIKAL